MDDPKAIAEAAERYENHRKAMDSVKPSQSPYFIDDQVGCDVMALREDKITLADAYLAILSRERPTVADDDLPIAEAAERIKASAEAWLGEIDPHEGHEHAGHWRDELAVADALLSLLSRERSAVGALKAAKSELQEWQTVYDDPDTREVIGMIDAALTTETP